MLRRILFAAGIASTALAQVGAPQLGWVPDQGHIRPVQGIPAAAAVGPALLNAAEFSQIATSPAGNYVLVSAMDTGVVSVYTSDHGPVALEGAAAAPDSIVLSPRGSAAALWYSSTHQVHIVTGLPDAPRIRQANAYFLGSAPVSLAVSDDGAWVAGAWKSGVYAFGSNGEVSRLPADTATAVAFFQGTHELAAAGPAGLRTITGMGGFAVATTLLSSGDASLEPVAVAATAGNRALLVADRSGAVTSVDVASRVATTSDCGCLPQGLFGMGSSAFRLTGLEDGAFKLFDTAVGEILFAPVALDVSPVPSQGAAQ